jgi:hypothetical protein
MPNDTALPLPTASSVGMTVKEFARLFRVNPDKVRAWIKSGQLGAVNTAAAQCSKPRFVVLPRHLEEFERRRSATLPPNAPKRRKRVAAVDYYPD